VGYQIKRHDDGTWIYGWGNVFPADPLSNPKNAEFYRIDLGAWYRWVNDAWTLRQEGGAGSSLTVQEVDGAPVVANVTTLQVDQSDGIVLTDLGAGVVRLDLSGIPVGLLTGYQDPLAVAWYLGQKRSGGGF
jgi:hypothetical protein